MRRVRPFTVYRIRVEQERFQRVLPDDPATFRARFPKLFTGYSLQGHVLSDPVRCHTEDPSKPPADFSAFLPGSFVCGHDAKRTYRTNVISQVLWGDCDLVALDVGGTLRYAVNVRVCNCFDRRAARYETQSDDTIGRIERYAFHRDRMNWNVFKTPETGAHEIFTCTGSSEGLAEDPLAPRFDDEFMLGYREEQFTGLQFDEVWTAPAQPLP